MTMKEITVLGNFSGRNAGDAAILGCLLEDITRLYKNVLFKIATINTGFVRRTYERYPVKPISLLPWNLSLKIFGLPTFWSALHSDLILITDAIMFDRRLYNPLFNYLSTLALLAPMAKKRGIPIVLYNVSLGPIFSDKGRQCLERVIQNAEIVILRDLESAQLLEMFQIHHPDVRMAADCAINTLPCDSQRLEGILKRECLFSNERPTVGFNVNSYIDTYVRGESKGIGRKNFLEVYAATVDRVIDEFGVEVAFVETQHMDLGITTEVMDKIKNRDRIKLVSNKTYSYEELSAILETLELFVGMRTHSLVLSSSVGTPVVGVVTYPKNRGYLRSIEQDEFMIEFKDFSVDNFYSRIKSAWEQRDQIRERLKTIIPREKQKARRSAEALAPFLRE